MRLVADPYNSYPVDVDVSGYVKNFVGSTNGSLTRFLGIPFAKPPYASPVSTHFYSALTPAQNRKQALPPS